MRAQGSKRSVVKTIAWEIRTVCHHGSSTFLTGRVPRKFQTAGFPKEYADKLYITGKKSGVSPSKKLNLKKPQVWYVSMETGQSEITRVAGSYHVCYSLVLILNP